MIIGFFGADGRTDSSHAALLAAHALAAVDVGVTLLVSDVGRGGGAAPVSGPRVAEIPSDRRGAAALAARALRAAPGAGVVADLPLAWLDRGPVRDALDVAVLVVGPHEADERAAARIGRASPARPLYLGCRRAGGGPAAARFAAAMAGLDPGATTLPLGLPPLGRGEAAALGQSAPGGRALRAGMLLVAAIGRTALGGTNGPAPGEETAERLLSAADGRSMPDRLRELADDFEAHEAGLGPTAADLAGAPVLEDWTCDAVAAPILKGRVSGHPNIADGRRARTSEVFLSDRATWARTLSRWYVLRPPGSGPRPH